MDGVPSRKKGRIKGRIYIVWPSTMGQDTKMDKAWL